MMRFNNFNGDRGGDGTAGKIIKDPTLYNSLNQTSSEIKSDIRFERIPISNDQFKLFNHMSSDWGRLEEEI